MNATVKLLSLSLLTLCCTLQLQAQPKARSGQQKSAPRPKAKMAEPPPMQEMPQPAINFDTTAAANDAVTADIRRMMEAVRFKEVLIETVSQSLQQNSGQIPSEIRTQFQTRFLSELQQPQVLGWLENMFVKAYRSHFTQAEIRELMTFYQTDLGKKFVQVTPALTAGIMNEAGKVGEYLGIKVGTEIMNEQSKK